jgi:hypothetical protein
VFRDSQVALNYGKEHVTLETFRRSSDKYGRSALLLIRSDTAHFPYPANDQRLLIDISKYEGA